MRTCFWLWMALGVVGCGDEPKDVGSDSDSDVVAGDSDVGGGDSDVGAGDSLPAADGGCDFRPLGDDTNYCQDYTAEDAVLAPYQSNCTDSGGTWLAGGCDTTGTIGGCSQTTTTPVEIVITNWFYDVADASKDGCESDGSTWIAP